MGVARPSDVNAAFADGFNRRDVNAMLALYDPEGGVVEMDGTLSVGTDEIRGHLERLVALGGRMESVNLTAVELGDLALVTAAWTITDSTVAPRMDGPQLRGAASPARRNLGVPHRPTGLSCTRRTYVRRLDGRGDLGRPGGDATIRGDGRSRSDAPRRTRPAVRDVLRADRVAPTPGPARRRPPRRRPAGGRPAALTGRVSRGTPLRARSARRCAAPRTHSACCRPP